MNALLLAHAGHLHTETITETGFVLSYTTAMWLFLIAGSALVWGIGALLFKQRVVARTAALSTFLMAYSIASYQHAGIYSAVSLTVGACLALVIVNVRLSAASKQ